MDPTTELCCQLLGLTTQEAEEAVESAGYRFRLCGVDGVPKVVTRDYRTDRISVHIEKDRVIRANRG